MNFTSADLADKDLVGRVERALDYAGLVNRSRIERLLDGHEESA